MTQDQDSSTPVASSPFIKSPSCVTFDSTFHIHPDAIGASIVRCRAPRYSSTDPTTKSLKKRRRFTFTEAKELDRSGISSSSPNFTQEMIPRRISNT